MYLHTYMCTYVACNVELRQKLAIIITSNKNFILDVGMEKEQKQKLGWRVSVLPIPAFHCILCKANTANATLSGPFFYDDVGVA